jgi:hypothetical protein
VCTSPFPILGHMPLTTHCSWFHNPDNIWWGAKIMNLINVQFPPLPCYLAPLEQKYEYLPQEPILQYSQPTSFPQYKRPGFTPISSKCQNCSAVYCKLYFTSDSKRQGKIFWTDW